jgi:hypothetical protein
MGFQYSIKRDRLLSSAGPGDRLCILTVAARPFFPANTGGRIEPPRFSSGSRLHQVTMLCFTTPEDSREHVDRMRACCSHLETVAWTESRKFTSFLCGLTASLASPLPYTGWKYRDADMQRRIRARLGSAKYDLLLCDFLQPSINCIDEPFRPKVLFQHNVEAMIQACHAARRPTRSLGLISFEKP